MICAALPVKAWIEMMRERRLPACHTHKDLVCCSDGGIVEEYNEDDEDGYMSDDSVDPDNMTYEVNVLSL